MRNPWITDAVEKYHPISRTSKQWEETKNTRFNEVRQIAYVLRARKREFFIDSIINYNIMHTLEEDSAPLFIAKKI